MPRRLRLIIIGLLCLLTLAVTAFDRISLNSNLLSISPVSLSTVPDGQTVQLNYLSSGLVGLKSVVQFRQKVLADNGAKIVGEYYSPLFEDGSISEELPWRQDVPPGDSSGYGVEFGLINPFLLAYPYLAYGSNPSRPRMQMNPPIVSQGGRLISTQLLVDYSQTDLDQSLEDKDPADDEQSSAQTAQPNSTAAVTFLIFNALDLGYNWVSLSITKPEEARVGNHSETEQSASFEALYDKPLQIGYRFDGVENGCLDGVSKCNMLSLSSPALFVKLSEAPSVLTFKFWRMEPKSKDTVPDISYLIDVIPGSQEVMNEPQ